jgi:hypothetical protein
MVSLVSCLTMLESFYNLCLFQIRHEMAFHYREGQNMNTSLYPVDSGQRKKKTKKSES